MANLSPLMNPEENGSAAVGENSRGPSGVRKVCDSKRRAAASGDRIVEEEEDGDGDDWFQGRGGSFPAAMARSNA